MKLTFSPSPHLKSGETTSKIMFSVILALLPAGFWGVYKFGIQAAWVVVTAVVSCVAIEFITQKFIFKTEVRVHDGSAALTGLLMSLSLPPGLPLWEVIIGSFAAIFIVKECFGGLGFNIFNPALIGRGVLLASFPIDMTHKWQVDGITQATPLALVKEKITGAQLPSHQDLFFGNIPGSIGEVSKLLLLLGAIYLFSRRIISWQIPLTYLATVFVLSIPFGQDLLWPVLTGGLILGAFFMATDYVTSPMTNKGKIIFGFGCGLLTVLIRKFAAYPEGVCYAILMMNILVPLIDRFTQPRVFGGLHERNI